MTVEDKRRALGLLRIEIENIRQRGFGGLLCAGTSPGSTDECSETCPLLDLAPPERRKARNPCLHIPLNKQGETVETIAKRRSQAYLEEQLLTWMEQTAKQLQEDLWQKPSADLPPLLRRRKFPD